MNRNTAHTSTKTAQFSKKVLKICTPCAALLLLLLSASAASAATITLGDGDGADYTTIQVAVDYASGDCVVDAWGCTYMVRAIAGVPGYNV